MLDLDFLGLPKQTRSSQAFPEPFFNVHYLDKEISWISSIACAKHLLIIYVHGVMCRIPSSFIPPTLTRGLIHWPRLPPPHPMLSPQSCEKEDGNTVKRVLSQARAVGKRQPERDIAIIDFCYKKENDRRTFHMQYRKIRCEGSRAIGEPIKGLQ
jgi:hypothetical protein